MRTRGNQSTYSTNANVYDSKKFVDKDFRKFSDDELAEAWKHACRRDPFVGLYDRLKNTKLSSLDCGDLRDALEFLYGATGDDDFQAAVLAMKRHGFTRGGLKQTGLAKISKQKHSAWAAMPKMHVWIENEKISVKKAAKFVAVQMGICGKKFITVAERLRKTYPKWLKSTKAGIEAGKTL